MLNTIKNIARRTTDRTTEALNSDEAKGVIAKSKESLTELLEKQDVRIILAGTAIGAILGMLTLFSVSFGATIGLLMSTYHVVTRSR